MVNIQDTALPGLGLRHEFDTAAGARVGVLTHRTGRRELLVYGPVDPDTPRDTIVLNEEEGHALAELLGGSRVTRNLVEMFQHSLHGLTIEWVAVQPEWASAGGTIGDTMLRTRTGVSVVAIVRHDQTIPSPTPDAGIEAGDTLVVVGTPDGLRRAGAILQEGNS